MIAVVTMLDTMRPIGLAEVTARASLLARMDRKFIVPVAELPALLSALAPEARVLEIDGRRAMTYRSVYFDTPDLRCYRAAAHRRRRRFKVRVRTYLEDRQQFLEVKTRGIRGATVKHRAPYSGQGGALAPADHRWVASVLADGDDGPAGASTATVPGPFGPVLTTTYRRTTLFLPADASRTTIDTDLAWHRADGATLTLPGFAILETKTRSSISSVDRLLWSRQHRPESVSKYGTGLAALRHDLPASRWRPVLRRYFTEGLDT